MGNQGAKLELIKLYGAECFIDKLHLRFENERKYSSKKQKEKMKRLTFHHIVEKYRGRRNNCGKWSFT